METNVDKVQANIERSETYVTALFAGFAATSPTATVIDRDRALTGLRRGKEALGEAGLLDRRINLLTGRLLRLQGRYDDAIEALTHFISEKERRGQIDTDLADAYYNRACYYAIKMSKAESDEKNLAAKEMALADLATSIKYNPENRSVAGRDEDFASLSNDERFRGLIEEK